MCFGIFLKVSHHGQVSCQHNKMWNPPTWTESIKGQQTSSAQSFHFYSAANWGISISRWFWWHLTLWRQCLPTLSHQSFSQGVPATARAAGPRQIACGSSSIREESVSLIQRFPRGEEDKSFPGGSGAWGCLFSAAAGRERTNPTMRSAEGNPSFLRLPQPRGTRSHM